MIKSSCINTINGAPSGLDQNHLGLGDCGTALSAPPQKAIDH
ncbi:MAG TPA: hypothetical protein ACN46V_09745 [Prochlorococcus sp.]